MKMALNDKDLIFCICVDSCFQSTLRMFITTINKGGHVSLTWQHRSHYSFTGEGLVHDEFGFGSKVERTEGLKIIFVFRGNIGDHDRVC